MTVILCTCAVGQYSYLDSIYSTYVDNFNRRDSLRKTCTNTCTFDINGLYNNVTVKPILSSSYLIAHPYYCGVSCYVKAYANTMIHYSDVPNEYDKDDICWSKGAPTLQFDSIKPQPMRITIHHKNAAVVYPAYQTLAFTNPKFYEGWRGVGFGQTMIVIMIDISGSIEGYEGINLALLDLLNTMNGHNKGRVIIFSDEARTLNSFMDITHSSLERMASDICGLYGFGGTKPEKPFEYFTKYIQSTELSGNDMHVIYISDMRVYQSKKRLHKSIETLRNTVLASFATFQLHMFDTSSGPSGRAEWMKEFACEFDGHYVKFSGSVDDHRRTMALFMKTLRHRMNALPVGTQFPFVKISGTEYDVFTPSGISLVRPYYVDVSSVDKLFPLRHAWTFSASYSKDDNIASPEGYYPVPTISRPRKYVLDTILGYQCNSFADFSPDDQRKITDSLKAFEYEWRAKADLVWCPMDRMLNQTDQQDRSLFCVESDYCPSGTSINKYNYTIMERCSASTPVLLLVMLLVCIIVI